VQQNAEEKKGASFKVYKEEIPHTTRRGKRRGKIDADISLYSFFGVL